MEFKERSYEETDRDGRWFRSFSLRAEPWVFVEHWACENNFRMIAVKGSRRLYVKNQEARWLRQYVEVKAAPNNARLEIKAWMLAGWGAKLASFYRIPTPLNLLEQGWIGMRTRRGFTTELNALLIRFRQSVITGSTGFHWNDMRPETLAFGGGLALISLLFPLLFLAQMPLSKAWLGYSLTQTLNQFLWVAVPAVVSVGILATVYRFSEQRWVRSTTAAVIFFIALGIAGYRFHTDVGKHVTKVAFANCFESIAHSSCQVWLQSIPADKRMDIIRQLERLRLLVLRTN